jgi:hypothetical protein
MPQVPYDFLDRVSALEERVRFLEGRAQIRPAMNGISGGDVTVTDGGTFKVLDLDSSLLFQVGKLTGAPHPDGSEQRGVIMRREDGTLAIALANTGVTLGQPQVFSISDAHTNVIFAEDIVAGGLATPYLAASGWTGETEQPAYFTTSTSFTGLMFMPWIKHHPRIRAHYLIRASDGSTTGEARLVDGAGTQIGPTVTIGAGAFTYGYIEGSIDGTQLSQTYLHWQGRVTGGPGNVGVKGLTAWGIQS